LLSVAGSWVCSTSRAVCGAAHTSRASVTQAHVPQASNACCAGLPTTTGMYTTTGCTGASAGRCRCPALATT
jgi:hypothetical protein